VTRGQHALTPGRSRSVTEEIKLEGKVKADKYDKQIRRATVELALLAIAVVLIWLSFGYFSRERATHFLGGTYGDSFGVLTALFTGLAVAGLWYTLRLQRIELAATRDVLGDQSQSLRTQVLEGTFFQLLRRFSEVQEGVRYGNVMPGRESIRNYYEQFRGWAKDTLQKNGITAGDARGRDSVLATFSLFLKDRQAELHQYFRVIYHLFKFIRDSGLDEDAKARYANLARAQLSSYELCLLFYNGAVGEGKEGMKPLIEQFGLLKHLDASLLIDEKHRTEWGLYDGRAFMSYEDRKNTKVATATGRTPAS
jgi:hypothetical protein